MVRVAPSRRPSPKDIVFGKSVVGFLAKTFWWDIISEAWQNPKKREPKNSPPQRGELHNERNKLCWKDIVHWCVQSLLLLRYNRILCRRPPSGRRRTGLFLGFDHSHLFHVKCSAMLKAKHQQSREGHSQRLRHQACTFTWTFMTVIPIRCQARATHPVCKRTFASGSLRFLFGGSSIDSVNVWGFQGFLGWTSIKAEVTSLNELLAKVLQPGLNVEIFATLSRFHKFHQPKIPQRGISTAFSNIPNSKGVLAGMWLWFLWLWESSPTWTLKSRRVSSSLCHVLKKLD